MDVIAKIICEDCGTFVVSGTNRVDLFTMNLQDEGDVYTLVTTCQFCDRPIIEDISVEKARKITDRGVPLFSWYDGKKHERIKL